LPGSLCLRSTEPTFLTLAAPEEHGDSNGRNGIAGAFALCAFKFRLVFWALRPQAETHRLIWLRFMASIINAKDATAQLPILDLLASSLQYHSFQ
jgi:hypothetical protein